ncbi:transposable element Tcb1 transposase [Trichonephila clavipes]|uniref:Transposable element Tcb1 transposase n=1 Tax=Trichonephila clavipes TaxID=2585209 RepID=A0A8X6SGJ6_TRICX|nr:transposable element Tcb1 transposase [Trichonephila clavipes]
MSRRKQKSFWSSIRVRQRKDSSLPRYCGLSFRKIGSRVGRNKTTVMQICDRRMQSGLSARHPLQGLSLTHNNRRLRCQWFDERRMWAAKWNEVVFTDESRVCLQHHDGRIRVWIHRGERMLNICFIHHHTGPALGIMVCGGIGYPFLSPLVRIVNT